MKPVNTHDPEVSPKIMQEMDSKEAVGPVPAKTPARRSFLAALLGVGTASGGALLAAPIFKFAVHPLLRITTPVACSEVGKVDEFGSATGPLKKLITVELRDGRRRIVSEKSVYVIKNASADLSMFSSVCPHLGQGSPAVIGILVIPSTVALRGGSRFPDRGRHRHRLDWHLEGADVLCGGFVSSARYRCAWRPRRWFSGGPFWDSAEDD